MLPKKIRNRGFTAVELIIVIVVIGILASISLAVYSGIQDKAYRAKLQVSLKQYQTLIALANDRDIELMNQTCLGQPSDYPATSTMAAGVCASGSGAPHTMQLPLSTQNQTYSILSSRATPSSIDARITKQSSGGINFRGAAMVRGTSVDSGNATYLLYVEPPGGCLDNDVLASSFDYGPGHSMSHWKLENVCAQEIKDVRILCRDFAPLAAMGVALPDC